MFLTIFIGQTEHWAITGNLSTQGNVVWDNFTLGCSSCITTALLCETDYLCLIFTVTDYVVLRRSGTGVRWWCWGPSWMQTTPSTLQSGTILQMHLRTWWVFCASFDFKYMNALIFFFVLFKDMLIVDLLWLLSVALLSAVMSIVLYVNLVCHR